MDNMTAALVGGLFDESGISAYARPVLFGTAGDAVRDALPDAVEKCYFVHDEREPELAGAESLALDETNRFASLKALPECALPSGADARYGRLRRERPVCRAAGL